ncbi:MAG: MFS transporter [Planctomycetales bacterium]|nr:MFS transporter [Planctomycetales bacterium]
MSADFEASSETFDPISDGSNQRNFVVLVAYQVLLRIGWIFKTESIIIPAVLDSLGANGWVRGILPTLNRFGQSVPPILVSSRLARSSLKSVFLFQVTAGMALMMALFPLVWLLPDLGIGQTILFLVLYGLFFVFHGIHMIAFSTLQGKLIPVARRGRLLLVANTVGAIMAMAAAWQLLARWLHADAGDFPLIFGFASLCFGLSAVSSLLVHEPADKPIRHDASRHPRFHQSLLPVVQDGVFRKFALVAFLFGTSMTLFPHYQSLARQELGIPFTSLTTWVIVQNLGTALISLAVGPLADRFGNRLVLRITMLGIGVMPLMALTFAECKSLGTYLYPLVFMLFGLTPVTIRTLNNFTLELTDAPNHPRYLSAVALCVSLPIFVSPLVGLVIDVAGFAVPFLLVSALVMTGWVLTFTIHEPRRS